MGEIDLWGNTDVFLKKKTVEETEVENINFKDKEAAILIKNEKLFIYSKRDLTNKKEFESFLSLEDLSNNNVNIYKVRLGPINAFVTRHLLIGVSTEISSENAKKLSYEANKILNPAAKLTTDGKHVEVTIPLIKFYKDILMKVNAYPTQNGYRIILSKVLDLEILSQESESKFPKINFSKEVLSLNRDPIVGFDGSLNSLKEIPVSSLNLISVNAQSWKSLEKSKKTLEEKMEIFGIKTLHDLLFWLPKRYIDKSKPQDISDLIEGESATILGHIINVSDLPKGMGVSFQIETSNKQSIRVSFFRQNWLRAKFKIGSEVLVTGKFQKFRGQPQLGGTSIDHAEEAAILPIIPIYKQSEAKGITTYFIMAANRELISRMGHIKLPVYLRAENRMDYHEALKELHFPTSLKQHYEAIETLAYYELVYMQVIMQETKEASKDRIGISQKGSEENLQIKAAKSLPFQLTDAQKRAIRIMNEKLDKNIPSSTILNADVGSGKTLVAQLSCLKSVDSGYQAVLIGPTEVLARQLFSTFEKLIKGLEGKVDKLPKVCYLGSGMKVKERRELLKDIASGEIDIIVGTTSVLSDTVKYFNLGFVCIDEQQKFGVEQRTKLLNSREDERIPDLLLQTATPIPRTTAQVYYGDMDMILMDEKPAGRVKIETTWIKEDPNEIIEQLTNPLWSDVLKEAEKGNQTFIITPLVDDNVKIDAASVKRTYELLQKTALSTLNVAFVHGQMKKDEQNKIMDAFRNKEYDVLVSSTVIEVGVDIPDATIAIVLSADRLGASSLHQIRGRVGRSSKPSRFYLVSLGKTENSQLRLTSLVENDNGFAIAKADLEIRGEGTVFSSNQSGRSELIFANLSKHGEKITEARDEAKLILKSPFRELALEDAKNKFESDERLF